MSALTPQELRPGAPLWPNVLSERLGVNSPSTLHAIGPVALLSKRRTALFCSARSPGSAILRAHDAARRMRNEKLTVISGFHSPIEKECLRILLRGEQPIIVCPARAIGSMRLPLAYRSAFDLGRLLFLSPFKGGPKRVTREAAVRRNEVVAALADDAYVAYSSPGGRTDAITAMLGRWGVRLLSG